MKRLLVIGLVLLLVCVAAWGGYFLGDQHGFDRALVLRGGEFVGTLDALQKLRAEDIEGGTRRIESLCFAAANTVYGKLASGFVAKTFIDELRQYRQTYRTNSAEWSPAEQNLEAKLAACK